MANAPGGPPWQLSKIVRHCRRTARVPLATEPPVHDPALVGGVLPAPGVAKPPGAAHGGKLRCETAADVARADMREESSPLMASRSDILFYRFDRSTWTSIEWVSTTNPIRGIDWHVHHRPPSFAW